MYRLLALALTGTFLATGCTGSGRTSCQKDTDGDGLDDCEERRRWGTSPLLADTDGDGLDDGVEVVELGFNPENNNYKFNPRIADVPQVGIELTAPPDVTLFYTNQSGTEVGVSTERSESSAQTVTQSESTTNSQSVEMSHSVGAEVTVGYEVGLDGGASGSVSVNYQFSHTSTEETSFTWSQEQSIENATALSNARTAAQSESTEVTGGALATTLRVSNDGLLAFTVQSLVLGAVMNDPTSGRVIEPIGNLSFDGGSLPSFTLGPGETTTDLVFSKGDLDVGTTESLLRDASGLNLRVAVYELVDENGVPFKHDLTTIFAKTASVILDYGGNRPTERYHVATNVDPETLRVRAADALTEILRIPYTLGGDAPGGIQSIRDIAAVPSERRYWLVLHITTDGVTPEVRLHDPTAGDYSFDDIELKSGDVLHFVFFEDPDGDRLGNRQESAYGTSPDDTDSDDDGLDDYAEVYRHRLDPADADTDGDGLQDGHEVFRGVALSSWTFHAVTFGGRLYGGGRNCDGAVGHDPAPVFGCPGGVVDPPVPIGSGTTWRSVTATIFQSVLALDDAGVAHAWGQGSPGVLGLGDADNRSLPTALGAAVWKQMSAGHEHVLAIRDDGTLWSWGKNYYGELGRPFGSPGEVVNVPTQVGSDSDWRLVAAGAQMSYGIRNDGSLWAWGRGGGFLGLGDPDPRTSPTRLGTANDWSHVTAGQTHTIAIKTDGTMWIWGSGNRGLMGSGQTGTVTQMTPTRLTSSSGWTSADAGPFHSLALKSNGTLWSWGRAPGTGLGTDSDVLTPTQVGTSTEWAFITTGNVASAAIRNDGTLWTWGDNSSRLLGLGTAGGVAVLSPQRVDPH